VGPALHPFSQHKKRGRHLKIHQNLQQSRSVLRVRAIVKGQSHPLGVGICRQLPQAVGKEGLEAPMQGWVERWGQDLLRREEHCGELYVVQNQKPMLWVINWVTNLGIAD
jgi:hypothetical protein